jgi:hypothetical protein
MKRLLFACVAALTAGGELAAPACAQHIPPSGASAPANDAQGAPAALRRDPFVRPTDAAAGMPAPSDAALVPPAQGLAALSRAQITVRGLLEADGRHVALVQGPDKKHYVIRPGDRLRDGVVQAVVRGGLLMAPNGPRPVGDGATGSPRKPLPYAGENH